MMLFIKTLKSIIILILFATLFNCSSQKDKLEVKNLCVEYMSTPLGIDIESPRFSWQMESPSKKRGHLQTAYQVVVKESSGTTIWNSGIKESDKSLSINYEGKALKASTRYNWKVTIWDQNGQTATESSWFETGLMNDNPDLSAWDNAKWIGGDDKDLVLFTQYLINFKLKYNLTIERGSSKAGFIYGANDLRLMNKYRNIYQLENAKNESYIKAELDISHLSNANGNAQLHIYRVGYSPDDSSDKPFHSFDIKRSVINNNNKHRKHNFELSSAFGRVSIKIDGKNDFFEKADEQQNPFAAFMGRGEPGSVNLNPVGSGGDYLPFGMLCDIGFSVDAGQKAYFSELEIFNHRNPNNTLFKENLSSEYNGIFKDFANNTNSGIIIKNNTYFVNGGTEGAFIVKDPSRNSAPMLRTEFNTKKAKISNARLYITARGIYEIFINGRRVGEDYYNPGLTQYNKSHLYQTYDVTKLINKGENAIGALMSEGWWSGQLSFGSIWNHFGDRQSLLAKLVINYSDGTKEIITTNDKNWKYFNDGPIIYSSLNMGEVYDATKESDIEGWDSPGYNDSSWENASEVLLSGTSYSGSNSSITGEVSDFNFDNLKLAGQIGNSAGIYKMLMAKSVDEVREGVFVYNMGQNFVGVPRIEISNGISGDTMILRVSEMLYPDLEESGNNTGMIMTENYRAALCQDIYIMKDGQQIFQPKFTSRGYQYIEITGIEEALPLKAVKGIAISSVLELTADYHTSNKKINQLWSNIVWSNVDNFLTIPTDCPQRNERMGWSGDISVFSRTATYISNSNQFFKRHMLAMRDVQSKNGRFADIAPIGNGFGGILWGSAGITVPWESYQQYSDISLLEENYDAMTAYIDFLASTISNETGLSSDGQLGDWLGPQNNLLGVDFLATAYHVYDLWIIMNTAELLGKKDDVIRFRQMYDERKKFFNTTFVNKNHKTLGIQGGIKFGRRSDQAQEYKVADTQTSYAVGLALGVFSDENIPFMVKNLAETIKQENIDDDGILRPEYSLMTGFIGTAWISKALSDYGYSDLAYKLIQNNKYPSWLYAVDQGATTIWERLNGFTIENGFGGNNSMNSFNHYSFGAVGQWMIAHSLGIQRDKPGFKHFILKPEPDPTGEMKNASGYYDSMYGRISSSWETDQDKLVYKATVPANTSATLYLPAKSEINILENGKPVSEADGITFLKYEDGNVILELISGEYKFESNLK